MKSFNITYRNLFLLLTVLMVTMIICLLAARQFLSQRAFPDKVEFYVSSLEIMNQRQAQNLPSEAVLFFGDSHIQGLSVTSISPNAVNFGIGHLTIQRLSKNLSSYKQLKSFDKIIIAAGINDLLTEQNEELIYGLTNLLEILECCQKNSYILSLLPVNEKLVRRPLFNKKIISFNAKIKDAVNKANVNFIDVYSFFEDDNGQLLHSYDLGDGLHLNKLGYEQLINRIKLAIAENNVNGNEQNK